MPRRLLGPRRAPAHRRSPRRRFFRYGLGASGSALIGAIVCLLLIQSCGVTPAAHLARAPEAAITSWEGAYVATFHHEEVGSVSTLLHLRAAGPGLAGATRLDAAWDLIGGIESILGPLLAPRYFPRGVIAEWESTLPRDGEPGEGVIRLGRLKGADIRTKMTALDRPIELFLPDGRRAGLLTLEPAASATPPRSDYAALVASAEAALGERLFDPALAGGMEMRAFLSRLHKVAQTAQDDGEFVFGIGAAIYKNLRLAHVLLAPPRDGSAAPYFAAWRDDERGNIRVSRDKQTGIATIKVVAFIDPETVDRAFRRAIARNPSGLIIDLRTCPGVTASALRSLAWLIDEPVDVGIFLGPESRAAVLSSADGLPDGLPRADLTSPGDFGELDRIVAERGAVAATVHPAGRTFTGPVAVLITGDTSSTAEALAWAVQHTGRGVVIGTRSAGRTFVFEQVDAGQGWGLILPTYEFLTPAGERLFDRGVRPDIEAPTKAKSEEAARERLLSPPAGDSL